MQSPLPLKVLSKFALFSLVGIGLSWVTANSPAPENSENLWYAVPAFLVFILFVTSLFSWGAWVRHRVHLPFFSGSENAFFDLSIGSVLAYLTSYGLTPLGVFSSHHSSLLWFILGFGFAFGSEYVHPRLWFTKKTTRFATLLSLVPFSLVCIKLIEGLQFHQHGDAYLTYIPAPRSWAALGNFSQYLQFTEFFLSTSIESLYAWGTALMHLTHGHGLDLSQWFSQWVTAGIGVLGLVFGITAICERLMLRFKINPIWIPVIVISGIQVPILQWLANLAKNDIGVSFWGTSAFYFCFFLIPHSFSIALLAGLITGAAVMGKLTLGVFGICLGIVVIIRAPKLTLPFAIGGVLGVLPVLLRNYFLTENPFFPWLTNVFHTSYLNPSDANSKQVVTTFVFHGEQFLLYLKEIFLQIPLCIALVFAMGFKIIQKKDWLLIAFPVAALLGFTILFRPATEIRYQGPALIIFAALSCFFLFALIEAKFPTRFKLPISFLVAVGILATSNMSFFTLGQLGPRKFGPWKNKIVTLNETGGQVKLWLRQAISPEDSIFIVGDAHIHYLIDYPISLYNKDAQIFKEINTGETAQALDSLAKLEQKHLYFSRVGDYSGNRAMVEKTMHYSLEHWNHECLEFEASEALVWNLKCIQKEPARKEP